MLPDQNLCVFKVRGGGPYMQGTRGGQDLYSLYDFEPYDLPRGGARFSFSKLADFARNAWTGVKKIILPFLKKEGPAYAQRIMQYGAEKAQNYINDSNKFGPAKGLIQQALLDLPVVVTDIIKQKIDNDENPLDEQSQQFLIDNVERGAGLIANGGIPSLTQTLLVDAKPFLAQAANILQQKYAMIDDFAADQANGKWDWTKVRMFYQNHGNLEKAYKTDDEYAQYFFTMVLEDMIVQTIQHAVQLNLVVPGSPLYRFLVCCNMLKRRLLQSPDGAKFIEQKQRRLCTPKHELCDGLCVLKEGATDIDATNAIRGGFPGAAMIASTVIPAIANLIPAITTAIQDWRRGSGIPDHIEMNDLAPFLVNAIIHKQQMQQAQYPQSESLAVVPRGGKKSCKRKRL